jgi:hypothetical protein
MNQKPPIAIICKAIPFDKGGSATVIRNILSSASKGQVFVLGREPKTNIDFRSKENNFEFGILPLNNGPGSIILKSFLFIKSLFLAAKHIKANKSKKVLGVYRDETSFVLSYLITLILNLELYVYLTDLYAENYSSGVKKIIQKLVFKKAKRIFCLNDAMKDYFLSVGMKNVEVIPSTIPSISKFSQKNYSEGPFRIVYSGSIIYDRLDLLQKLVKLIGNNPDFELVFYSPHDIDFLVTNKLFANNVRIEFINDPLVLVEKLKEAHVLYLPLTFNKPDSQRSLLQLKTCLGTKSYEYMQSGVPILVHSPAEYYTYKFFEESNAAILLSSIQDQDLIDKLNEIKLNYSAFGTIVLNAHNKLNEHLSKPNYLKLLKMIEE